AVADHVQAGLGGEFVCTGNSSARRMRGHVPRGGEGRDGQQQGKNEGERDAERGAKGVALHADSSCSRRSLASSCGSVSGWSGSGSMHSTGQTATHCGSSKWPTHSVQRAGSIT